MRANRFILKYSLCDRILRSLIIGHEHITEEVVVSGFQAIAFVTRRNSNHVLRQWALKKAARNDVILGRRPNLSTIRALFISSTCQCFPLRSVREWTTTAITQVAANKLKIKTDVKCDFGSPYCYTAIVASVFLLAHHCLTASPIAPKCFPE